MGLETLSEMDGLGIHTRWEQGRRGRTCGPVWRKHIAFVLDGLRNSEIRRQPFLEHDPMVGPAGHQKTTKTQRHFAPTRGLPPNSAEFGMELTGKNPMHSSQVSGELVAKRNNVPDIGPCLHSTLYHGSLYHGCVRIMRWTVSDSMSTVFHVQCNARKDQLGLVLCLAPSTQQPEVVVNQIIC